MADRVGLKQNQSFQLGFNTSLKVDFPGSRVASDGGLILVRELGERLGSSELIEQNLIDSANDNLERDIAEFLTRPIGRPSHKPVVWYNGFCRYGITRYR